MEILGDSSIIIDLLDFLRTTQFGQIQFGISRNDLQRFLGSSNKYAYRHRKDHNPTILAYGDVEFWFISSDDDRLCAIYLDEFKTPQGDHRLQLEPHWIRGQLSQSDVEKYLRDCNIQWHEDRGLSDVGQLTFKLASGVELGFNADSGLSSIGYYLCEQFDLADPRKQIGLFIPQSIYERIRIEAESQNISMAKLCSQWVIERAMQIDED